MTTDNDRAQAHIDDTDRQITTDEAVLGIKSPDTSIDPRFAAAHYEHDLKIDPLLRAMQDDGIITAPQQAVSTLPERDPSKPAEAQGLFRKFDVCRVDGSDAPGGKHEGCEYFVLDVDHDPHAPAALRAYAEACKDTHPQLSADLQNRHGGPHTNVVNALIRERDGYQESTRLLQERLRLAQLDLDLRRAHQEKDVWFFQGDGDDHIESMGNGMVVVIHASDLRALLASQPSNYHDAYRGARDELLALKKAVDAKDKEIIALQKQVKQHDADAEMYARAWERELRQFDGKIINKRHHIDALVLTTQDLVEKARRALQPSAQADVAAVRDANNDLLTYVLQDDVHNRLTPRVIDIAYTAFMCAKHPNKEDGGASDWFTDTKPVVMKAIEKLRKDLEADALKSAAPTAQPQADGVKP